jgi:hypothetical protein
MPVEKVDEYFAGKPESRDVFDVVAARIGELGPSEIEVKSQISFAVDRKFAWFWLYNVTKKNPSGVPHLMLALDRRVTDPHVREVNQISNKRWNHQIVIRTLDDAHSEWLGELIAAAYRYGSA